jgi:mono/diheme cytochrome c family protein
MAGWGGAYALAAGAAAAKSGLDHDEGRLLVYKLGGTAKLPVHEEQERELAAVPADFDAALVLKGNHSFHRWCGTCHGVGAVSGGVLPDLRKSVAGIYDIYPQIVLEGAKLPGGMPNFSPFIGPDDVEAIRAYVLTRRAALLASQTAGSK